MSSIYPPEFLEKKYNQSMDKLTEFSDVDGMDEFCNLLNDFRTNEKFMILPKFVDYNLFKHVDKAKNIELIKNAKKGLNLSIFGESKVTLHVFYQVFSVIFYSCVCDFGRELSKDEINMVLASDLVARLTAAPDNFMNIEAPYLDKSFFKTFKKCSFSKRAKKLDKVINKGYWMYIITLRDLNKDLSYAFGECAHYLSYSYAFANGRKEVTPEDVLKGWTLTLNLFNMDLRPYVFK